MCFSRKNILRWKFCTADIIPMFTFFLTIHYVQCLNVTYVSSPKCADQLVGHFEPLWASVVPPELVFFLGMARWGH